MLQPDATHAAAAESGAAQAEVSRTDGVVQKPQTHGPAGFMTDAGPTAVQVGHSKRTAAQAPLPWAGAVLGGEPQQSGGSAAVQSRQKSRVL